MEEELDQLPTCSNFIEQTPSSSESLVPISETATSRDAKVTEELPGTSSETVPSPASSVTVVPLTQAGPAWKALIGEFTVQPAWLPSDFAHRTFSLQRIDQLFSISYCRNDEKCAFEEESHRADCSLSRISLGSLDWLLQRKVVQLCHQVKENSYRVGIYVLEAALGKPEFLSEGTTRLKKANQILQKMMEYFYDFIVPGKCLGICFCLLSSSLFNLLFIVF